MVYEAIKIKKDVLKELVANDGKTLAAALLIRFNTMEEEENICLAQYFSGLMQGTEIEKKEWYSKLKCFKTGMENLEKRGYLSVKSKGFRGIDFCNLKPLLVSGSSDFAVLHKDDVAEIFKIKDTRECMSVLRVFCTLHLGHMCVAKKKAARSSKSKNAYYYLISYRDIEYYSELNEITIMRAINKLNDEMRVVSVINSRDLRSSKNNKNYYCRYKDTDDVLEAVKTFFSETYGDSVLVSVKKRKMLNEGADARNEMVSIITRFHWMSRNTKSRYTNQEFLDQILKAIEFNAVRVQEACFRAVNNGAESGSELEVHMIPLERFEPYYRYIDPAVLEEYVSGDCGNYIYTYGMTEEERNRFMIVPRYTEQTVRKFEDKQFPFVFDVSE